MEQHALQGLANMQEWCVTQHKHSATHTQNNYSSYTNTYTIPGLYTYTDTHIYGHAYLIFESS